MTDCSQEDGIFGPQQIKAAGGNDLACPEIAIAAPVKRFNMKRNAVDLRDRVKHFKSLGGDFGPRSISGNRGNRKMTLALGRYSGFWADTVAD